MSENFNNFYNNDFIDASQSLIGNLLSLAAYYRHGYGIERDEEIAKTLEAATEPENYKDFILELIILKRNTQAGPYIEGLGGLDVMAFAGDEWEQRFKPSLQQKIEEHLTGDMKLLGNARFNELEEMVQSARDLKRKGLSTDKINEKVTIEINKRWGDWQVQRLALSKAIKQNPEEAYYDFLILKILAIHPTRGTKEEKKRFSECRLDILDPGTLSPARLKIFATYCRTGYAVKNNEAMAKQLEDIINRKNYEKFALEVAAVSKSRWDGKARLEKVNGLYALGLVKDWEKYQAIFQKISCK